MNLYFIYQNKNQNYDCFDSAVVAAQSEKEARSIHPSGSGDIRANMQKDCWEHFEFVSAKTRKWTRVEYYCDGWTKYPSDVEVTLIGTAVDGTKSGVICASFNAG